MLKFVGLNSNGKIVSEFEIVSKPAVEANYNFFESHTRYKDN